MSCTTKREIRKLLDEEFWKTEADPAKAGLGHMIEMLGGDYGGDLRNAQTEIKRQLKEGKSITWREAKAGEMGL